jgi:hypothetical protein
MTLTPNMKKASLIGAVSLLSIAAVAGWVRKPTPTVNAFNAPGAYGTYQNPQAAPYGTYPQPVNAYGQPAPQQMNAYGQPVATPVGYDVNGRPVYAQPPAYSAAYGSASGYCEPGNMQSVAYHEPAPGYRSSRVVRSYRPAARRVYYDDRTYVRRRGRSTGKSVAIVAGSAGAGAAIGALAGGGKGAAIGGLTGGAAGFLYDRLTANR